MARQRRIQAQQRFRNQVAESLGWRIGKGPKVKILEKGKIDKSQSVLKGGGKPERRKKSPASREAGR